MDSSGHDEICPAHESAVEIMMEKGLTKEQAEIEYQRQLAEKLKKLRTGE